MMSQYVATYSGADVCHFLKVPKELNEYEVEVTVRPIAMRPRKKSFLNFKKSIEKLKYDISKDYKFDRDKIYGYLYE